MRVLVYSTYLATSDWYPALPYNRVIWLCRRLRAACDRITITIFEARPYRSAPDAFLPLCVTAKRV